MSAYKQTHIRFDWAVKKMLRSKANFGILEGFLSELLKEDIRIQDILESEGNKETLSDKFNRVDILVKDSTGQLIIVEIQNTRELDYFYKIFYNTAKVTAEHMHSGLSYKNIRKVITVSVVYFDLGQGKDYVYHGETNFTGIHQQDILELSDKQKKLFQRESVARIYPEHYIIKVNEFDGVAKDTLDEWVYFLKNSEILDGFKARGLAEAREKLREINLPEELRPAYMYYLKEMSEEASYAETIRFEREYELEKFKKELDTTKEELDTTKEELDTTKEELDTTKEELDTTKEELDFTKEELDKSKKEAERIKTDAEKELAIKMASSMKARGLTTALIAEISGLSPEEIQRL